jgi:hypothetical protein
MTGLEIYLAVCWFFGLAGVVDVLFQPRGPFRSAGHSKLRWLLIELVGLPLVGIFTWAWYAIKIRPGVVRAGGRPPRTFINDVLSPQRIDGSGSRSPAPIRQTGTDGTQTYQGPGVKPCPSCGATGKRPCLRCGNRGSIRNPTNPPPEWIP